MGAVNHHLVSIYLNDHFAGSTNSRELVHRAAGNNRSSEYGAYLLELSQEIDEDHATLLALMQELHVGVDHMKLVGGWVAEKAGRLKLNGSLVSYSPLSRVVELEGLMLGVDGKRRMWVALDQISAGEPVLCTAGLPDLIVRADHQLSGLERQHRRAMVEALGSEKPAAHDSARSETSDFP